MRRTILPALALLLAFAGAAEARARPPQPIWDSVASRLDEEVNFATREADLPEREPAWMTTPTDRMFSRVDINGDGVADWRVDYEKAPNPSFFCGTGGCRQELWVSEPGGGHARVMSVGAGVLKVGRRGGVTRLDLIFHGSLCDGYGAQPCPRSYLWDQAAMAFVETPPPDGRTWLFGGPHILEPVNLESAAPPAVLAGLERMQNECGVNQGYFDPEWDVRRIPDIDGDGRRDWVIGSGYAACEYAMEDAANPSPELPILVYATNGGDDAVLAYEGRSVHFGVDMGPRPAALYIISKADDAPPCEYERPCGRRLRWDAASGKLVE